MFGWIHVPAVIAAVILIVGQAACSPAQKNNPSPEKNAVAAYLGHAERQAETDEQRQEIRQALTDMLKLPTAKLRNKRYPDYSGQANAWSAPEILRHFFVPNPPDDISDGDFYRDVDTPLARQTIQRQLDDLRGAHE